MNGYGRVWLLMALVVLGATAGAQAAKREELGRTEKLRVLVDKVLMADNNWVMTDVHVAEIDQRADRAAGTRPPRCRQNRAHQGIAAAGRAAGPAADGAAATDSRGAVAPLTPSGNRRPPVTVGSR